MDCENCAVPHLWPVNYGAWELYYLIANQFVYDFHALPLVFELYRPRLTLAEARLLFEKLVIIHSEMTRREEKEDEREGNLPPVSH